MKTTTVNGHDSSEYRQALTVFTPTAVTVKETLYLQAGCTQPSYTTEIDSTYVAGSLDGAVAGIFALDYTLGKITLTYHSQVDIGDLNDTSFCGHNDWVVETPRDITGQKCFESEAPLPDSGRKLFDIFALQGGHLSFGLTSEAARRHEASATDGSTPEQRPHVLDPTSAMTRTN